MADESTSTVFSVPQRIFVVLLCAAVVAASPAGVRAAAAEPLVAVAWVVFISLANLLVVPTLPRVKVDASLGAPVFLAAAVVLGPSLALVTTVAAITSAREFNPATSYWAILFNRAQHSLSVGAASLVAHSLAGGAIVRTLIAVLVYNLVNIAAISVWLYLRPGRTQRLLPLLRSVANPFPHFATDFGFVALLALFVVVAYQSVGLLAMALVAVPVYLGYSALRSARVAEDRAEALAEQVRELETLNALGAQLLAVRTPREVAEVGGRELSTVYGAPVEVTLAGGPPDARRVQLPGAEPAAIVLPDGADPPGVVAPAASLLSMALQRLELEGEVAAGQRARVALSGQILEEGTRERSRIALQIHDDVLPYFAAAEMQADNVRTALDRNKLEMAHKVATASGDAIHDGIASLREVLDALRSQVLVPGQLREGVERALEELRLTAGVEPSLEAPAPLPPMALASEIVALELVKGCLTNIARHAGADRVSVTIRISGETMAIEVRDDGRGFDTTSIPAGHHGLSLMSQRLQLARGRFRIDSEPGAGTAVQLEVPL